MVPGKIQRTLALETPITVVSGQKINWDLNAMTASLVDSDGKVLQTVKLIKKEVTIRD
jgi:hypothetical protein